MFQKPAYYALPEVFYQQIQPIPVASPEWVFFNDQLCNELGVSSDELKGHLESFSGNQSLDGIPALAQAYAGHQFAHFNILGDGRAHLIGELKDPQQRLWDIHLKGSGPTRFSRGGDGRAALGPMIREYLISEAMHALNIPTTRSLGVIKTGETTFREGPLPGAILIRMASSHLRVGTFEYAATLENPQQQRALLDFAIQRHHPEASPAAKPALEFLKGVIDRQARLIAQWMSVGFIHGVMNTDNMTISGETIDFGPCAFMDTYDAATVFSSIDRRGRYAYGQQPAIGQWNLTRLAETLLPMISNSQEAAQAQALEALNDYPGIFENHYFGILRKKLGLNSPSEGERPLFESLFRWLHHDRQDMTLSFRFLTDSTFSEMDQQTSEHFKGFLTLWKRHLEGQGISLSQAQLQMAKHNPVIIPRNHKVEEALNAASEGNLAPATKLLDALREPFSTDEKFQEFRTPLKDHSKTYQTFCGT